MTEAAQRRASCPRCGSSFECKPQDVANCECANIKVSAETRRQIGKAYEGCLCARCLAALESGTQRDRPPR